MQRCLLSRKLYLCTSTWYLILRIVYKSIEFSSVLTTGQLARQVYENMRRDAACLRIQRDLRMYLARKAYKALHYSAVSIQTGMRGMAARDELRFRRQSRAAIMIQVIEFLRE